MYWILNRLQIFFYQINTILNSSQLRNLHSFRGTGHWSKVSSTLTASWRLWNGKWRYRVLFSAAEPLLSWVREKCKIQQEIFWDSGLKSAQVGPLFSKSEKEDRAVADVVLSLLQSSESGFFCTLGSPIKVKLPLVLLKKKKLTAYACVTMPRSGLALQRQISASGKNSTFKGGRL